MLKFLALNLFFLSLSFAQEFPRTFYQLSTPLYTSVSAIEKLSNIQNIKELSDTYVDELEKVKKCGFEVDEKKEEKKTKEYLLRLRKLQKSYELILYRIHKNISNSIEKNDYAEFKKLTQYPFDGLLKSTALYCKSLEFYKENKANQKIGFFEEKMKYDKLELATSKEFFNMATRDTYDSTTRSKNSKNKVQIEAKDKGKYIVISVENLNPYTITIKIKDVLKNFNYDTSVRKEFPLQAGERKEYLRLYKQKGKFTFSYSFSYTWIIGSVDAKHDDSYLYRLPFEKGTSHRVTQGYNGRYTHKGHSQYAIDFGMKIGTKVYAARDGIVVKIKENSNKGGAGKQFSSFGNYITLEHDDATFATYYHLKQNGVMPYVGQKIKRGDLIAYSGNTGYSSGPHLHLSVFKASSASRTNTIPIKFVSQKGFVNMLKQGIYYTAK